MSTRHQKTDGPLSQERYMSSLEFAELRGISGVAVSARAALLLTPRKRNLVWFIQSLSLAEGGLRRVARELVDMFPDRIGTPAMRKADVKMGKSYPAGLLSEVEMDLQQYRRSRVRGLLDEDAPQSAVEAEKMFNLCREQAFDQGSRHGSSAPHISSFPPVQSIAEFLTDLCINPRLHLSAPGENEDFAAAESVSAMEANPELSRNDFKAASLVYFRDIIGALFEYQQRHEAAARDAFQQTAISRKVWETLDFALKSRSMVVLDGLEGRGKTESVKAWCALHQGQARFVSLKGVSNKTTIFREIAKALGIASSYTRTAPEMQARIEDVLKRRVASN